MKVFASGVWAGVIALLVAGNLYTLSELREAQRVINDLDLAVGCLEGGDKVVTNYHLEWPRMCFKNGRYYYRWKDV